MEENESDLGLLSDSSWDNSDGSNNDATDSSSERDEPTSAGMHNRVLKGN